MMLPVFLAAAALSACAPLAELGLAPFGAPPVPTAAQPAVANALQPVEQAAPASGLPPTPFVWPTEWAPAPTPVPSATAEPSATPLPTATPEPLPTATPEPSPTPAASPTPDPARQINGLPFEAIAPLDEATLATARAAFARGAALGRDPNRFSKLGDSAVLTDHNLTRFDGGRYLLGPYAMLQPTVDAFAGSWGRYGVGARVGLTAGSTFDPFWANKEWCQPEEHLLACEIRLNNPAFLLVRLGTNDGDPESFESGLRRAVEFSLEQGVIPVLATKADRWEGPDDRNNAILRRVAAEHHVPLIEFDLLAATLPNRGLTDDNAHLTVHVADDYTDPVTFTKGYPMSDLAALVMLDALRAAVGAIPPAPTAAP
jgi:hypothetical protein